MQYIYIYIYKQIKGNINKLIVLDVTIGLIKCPHKGNVTMH